MHALWISLSTSHCAALPRLEIRGGGSDESAGTDSSSQISLGPPPKRRAAAQAAADSDDSGTAVDDGALPGGDGRDNVALLRLKASGDKLYGLRDYTGAVTAYTAALRLAPRYPAVRANRAAALMMLRRYGEAAADAAHAAASDPALLAAGLMLDHVGLGEQATALRKAIDTVLNAENIRTGDLGGTASTTQFTAAICEKL